MRIHERAGPDPEHDYRRYIRRPFVHKIPRDFAGMARLHGLGYRSAAQRFQFKGVGTQRKLTIAPGPNNPVGLVWIDLTKASYGIHGTPRPEEIGKTQSHGCIRLTSWDALDLAKRVRKGAPVAFLDGDSSRLRSIAASSDGRRISRS